MTQNSLIDPSWIPPAAPPTAPPAAATNAGLVAIDQAVAPIAAGVTAGSLTTLAAAATKAATPSGAGRAPVDKSDGPATLANARTPTPAAVGTSPQAVADTQAGIQANTAAGGTVGQPAAAPANGLVAVPVQQPLPDATPAARAATATAAGLDVTQAATASPPAAQIGTALVAATQAPDGSRNLQLQLHPQMLGRLQISVVQAAGAPAQVTIAVEKTQTLALLAREDSGLQRALDQAGVAAAGRVLTLHAGLTQPPHTPTGPPAAAAAVAPLRQPDAAADMGGTTAGSGSGGRSAGSGRGSRSRNGGINAVAASTAAGPAAATAAASSGIDITA